MQLRKQPNSIVSDSISYGRTSHAVGVCYVRVIVNLNCVVLVLSCAKMAESAENSCDQLKHTDERESRLKSFKERQNEERYKKLEEIKAHAMAAQRFKEQKEQERRKRMEELKMREESHRQQVEERKKMIEDAERERLESIIRRNQEREARIEAKKKNERSSMVFAFGSSTPRMLEPLDNAASFWGHRRATSTHNITYNAAPLTRRQSERELDGGSKKRATSAGGLERSEDMRMSTSMYEVFHWEATSDSSMSHIPPAHPNMFNTSSLATTPQYPAGCVSGYVGRRRTDLMPTIPSKDSPTTPPRKPFARSPGRAYSMSRLDQLAKPRKRTVELPTLSETTPPPSKPLSRPNHSSVSRSMSHLAVGKAGAPHNAPQRPMRRSDSRSMHQLSAAPLPPPRTTRTAELRQKKLVTNVSPSQVEGPSRPGSSLSQQSASSVASSSVSVRHRTSVTPKRQRPVSIAVTGITSDQIKNGPVEMKKENKPPIPKARKSSLQKSQEKIIRKKTADASPKSALSPASTPKVLQSPVDNKSIVKESDSTENEEKDKNNGIQLPQPVENQNEIIPAQVEQPSSAAAAILVDKEIVKPSQEPTRVEKPSVEPQEQRKVVEQVSQIQDKTLESVQQEQQQLAVSSELLEVSDMSTSFSSKRLITTEEEAKAALAERRRLAREEAERQAEMERKRLEEEARLELERQQKEEEQQRLLIEQQRAAEEARLKEAIREAQKREEEEKQRKEEEQRLRLLKEEAERKAREEAERQKAELQEKLKNEEKEREARRKRVEAIMLRTRGKTNSGATPQSEEKNEENKSEKMNGSKIETFENKEIDENIKSNVETNKLEESKIILTENKISVTENGHKNEKDVETVNNLIQLDSLKNANTVIGNTINTDDSINSNDGWQENNTKADLLM
ncbi:MAP7 domain-containing protein 1 isoform X1 [Agrilus planipennis]|uniref:MAP7 domain-containing protein 1 isoform X1 n=1 Tax=Agrilus planipennis TaxID=224129 RepID=A0A7F5RHX1_AGRPL|nr:MAP7 domain-containing protein 1 isoform X1 [Agrilus planipennis]